jgi:hypothetical protein
LLIIGRNDFESHLEQLRVVLDRLQKAGLKVNTDKSTFFADKIEYLGFLLTRNGIKPVTKKVEAILNSKQPPKSAKEVRRFIGMINFYRDMWKHRSTLLAPLTELTSNKFRWEPINQAAFEAIKDVISRDVLLAPTRTFRKVSRSTQTPVSINSA